MSKRNLLPLSTMLLWSAYPAFGAPDTLLAIRKVGPLELSSELPGAAIFAMAGDLITGVLRDMPYPVGVVQLAVRAYQGPWVITLSSSDVARSSHTTEWSLPASALACEARDGDSLEIAVIFARRRLPAGRLDERDDWGHLVRSESIQVSCAAVDRARLDVVEVGARLVKPQEVLRVTHIEDVRVLTSSVPGGAILQLC